LSYLDYLEEVEPLVVVASLLLAVAVFIYSMATKSEVNPLPLHVRILHFLARLCCIPIIVISAGTALIYVCIPYIDWLPCVSLVCIFIALFIILIFWIFVVPILPDNPKSINFTKILYEAAQDRDLENLKPHNKG